MNCIIAYLVIGFIISIVFKVEGDNLETQFLIAHYVNLSRQEWIVLLTIGWLPILLWSLTTKNK